MSQLILDLACGWRIKNKIIREFQVYDSSELQEVCACRIGDIKGIGRRSVAQLQASLEAEDLTLMPCRMVQEPIRPGRITPQSVHQILVEDRWMTGHADGTPAPVRTDATNQDDPTARVTLLKLRNDFPEYSPDENKGMR